MRLFVTGASGYLGARFCDRALASGHEVIAAVASRPVPSTAASQLRLDITREGDVLAVLREVHPDAVIHAAAVNPGGASAQMAPVNTEGSRHLARAAAAVGARRVALSTDVVHDGSAGSYDDDAPATPLHEYGRSKAAGEQAILDELPSASVVRTSLIYGLHAIDRGTAGFASRLRSGQQLDLFTDVLRQPVFADTLIDALLELAAGDHAGRLNVAGNQVLTREAFGRRLLRWWGIEGDGLIGRCRAADVAASVPLDTTLRLERARALLRTPLPGVDEVLVRRPRS